jgi:TPR repeat protein
MRRTASTKCTRKARGGVPTDFAKAARLFRLVADQGLPAAQDNLNLLRRMGKRVPKKTAKDEAQHAVAKQPATAKEAAKHAAAKQEADRKEARRQAAAKKEAERKELGGETGKCKRSAG